MKIYNLCMKLPDDLRFRCEQYSHFQLDHINIYIYGHLPIPVNGEAFSERNNIHTTTLKREVIMHEVGHMIMKMNGNQPKGKKIHGIRIENNPKREQQADSIAKSMWEMPSVPYLGDYKVQNECNGVIEGNIGLEFQTVGKTWNVRKLKKNGVAYDYDGNLGHSGTLFDLALGTHVKTEFSDLEYVTPAVLELDPTSMKKNLTARKALVDYAVEAGEFHKSLESLPKNQSVYGYTAKKIKVRSKTGVIKQKKLIISGNVGDLNLNAINPKGTQSAHPQATIGVKFASIPKLISMMRADSPTSSYLHGATNSEVNEIAQKKTFQTVSGKLTLLSSLSDAGKGLVGLIQLNVIQFQKSQGIGYDEDHLPANDKTVLPLMQRTSFLSYYNKLGATDQGLIRSNLQAYHNRTDTKFYGLEINDTDLIAGQDNEHGEKKVTFRDWCYGFLEKINGAATATANDLLETTSGFDGVSKLYAGSPTLGAYGIATPTDIGNGRDGAILELRALKRDIEPNSWGFVAGVVFDFVCELNKPKILPVLHQVVNQTSVMPKIVKPKVPNTIKPFLTGAGSPLYK